jgi:hypothetical protein
LRVIAEPVQQLAALGTPPRGRQQVCGPLQQAVSEAQLQVALDAKAGVARSVHQKLLAHALTGHSRCGYRREEGSRAAACATAEERAVLAIQQAVLRRKPK